MFYNCVGSRAVKQGALVIDCVCEDIYLLKKTIAMDLGCMAKRNFINKQLLAT